MTTARSIMLSVTVGPTLSGRQASQRHVAARSQETFVTLPRAVVRGVLTGSTFPKIVTQIDQFQVSLFTLTRSPRNQ